MNKIQLKNGDSVELHNGISGTISSMNPSIMHIEIENENSFPTECHVMNIKYLNDEEVDGRDITLSV